MISKNNRTYISDWFQPEQKYNEGDTLLFEMPPFCSGDYTAKIYLDTDGDPYIEKSKDFYKGCRDYFIQQKD